MKYKMQQKQNQRIQQITNCTLIVGADIAFRGFAIEKRLQRYQSHGRFNQEWPLHSTEAPNKCLCGLTYTGKLDRLDSRDILFLLSHG